MPVRLPKGLTTVTDALKMGVQTPYDVMGVCTDYLQPAQSRGTDMTMKLHLWDLSCADGPPGLARHGMQIRLFHKELERFPSLESTGDILIVRNLKTRAFGSDSFGISNYATTWALIYSSSLTDSTAEDFSDVKYRVYEDEKGLRSDGRGPKPSKDEFAYAKHLLHAKDPSSLKGPAKSTALDVATIMAASGGQAPEYRGKYRLFQDLETPTNRHTGYNFADLLGEVVRVYDGGHNVEVKMTDYTENPSFYPYLKDEDHKSGFPPGRMTMSVLCWDEHAEYLRKAARSESLMLGMFLQLRNVQIKFDRNGAVLEGHLRGGSNNFGSGISIYKSKGEADDNPRLRDLLARRRDFKMSQMSVEPAAMLGKRKKEVEADSVEDASRKKGKIARRKERQRKAAEEKAKQKAEKVEFGQTRIATNQHVRCENTDVPLTAISDILTGKMLNRKTPAGNVYCLPFQNVRYKTCLRVYDYFPDNLQDFCVPAPHDLDHLGDDDPASFISWARTQASFQATKWEWQFYLLVADSNADENAPLMVVQVCGHDGDYLLNAEASDLRSDTRALKQLREKLFVLWGDLQEKKDETLKSGEDLRAEGVKISSRPFECFIREFGVEARTRDGTILPVQWERMFAMFGTRVC